MPDSQILSFGPYQLDTEKVQLWCETQPVRLTPKAFQVLCYVVERPGQLVTKEELFRILWADTVVSDAALTTCIQEIRKALQDNARSPQYLETVHRLGFRFIAPVATSTAQPVASSKLQVPSQEEGSQKPVLSFVEGGNGENIGQANDEMPSSEPPLASPSSLQPVAYSLAQDFDTPAPNTQHLAPNTQHSPSSRFTRSFVLAAVLLLTATILTVQYFSRPSLSTQDSELRTQPAFPLPDKPSLIVLPFVNLSGDATQEYFSDGVTADITSTLSRLSNLFVISRTSAFTYKDKPTKLKDISREMGVQYVLEGSVRKTAEQLRITVELIDATTDHPLWTEQYDRLPQNLFAVQDEIVQKIVTTLKLQLTLEEQGTHIRKHTDNLEAYDAFLRGEGYRMHFTKEATAQAQQFFEKAIDLDPQYAEAYAELAVTYHLQWVGYWNTDPQTLERALTLVQRALALDDSLPVAHALLGLIYTLQQQNDQAIVEGEQAVALDPNDADNYSNQAYVLSSAGRPAEALRAVEHAIRLNPHPPIGYLFQLSWAYFLTGRYTEAIATQKEILSRNPNFPSAHLVLASSSLSQWYSQQSPPGQTLEPAIAAIQRALALNDSDPGHHQVLGGLLLSQHQYDQALVEIERSVALAPHEAQTRASLAAVLGCVGRTEEALEAAAQTLRLKPFIPDIHLAEVGIAYALAGHYEEARAPLLRFLSRYPNVLPAHLALASVYSELGQEAEARAEAAEVLRINPKFSLEIHRQRVPVKDPAAVERSIAALRKAGLK